MLLQSGGGRLWVVWCTILWHLQLACVPYLCNMQEFMCVCVCKCIYMVGSHAHWLKYSKDSADLIVVAKDGAD